MKISHLYENLTPASAPSPNTSAPKFGRSDEMLESGASTTTAGVVSTGTSTNMGTQRRSKKGSDLLRGIKTSEKYANSRKAGISEDAINEDDISEEQLRAKQRREELFKRAKDREIGNRPQDKDILPKQTFENDEEYDDEAGMIKNNLHTAMRAVKGLHETINENENCPEWVQEKIAIATDYFVTCWDYLISQHEEGNVYTQTMSEVAPKGWEGTVKAMKKHKDIDNPWALAHWMKGKGYKSHKKDVSEAEEHPQAWMDELKALAHKMAPQDKLRQAHQERMAQDKERAQQALKKDIENLPELISQYNDMKSEYESLGGSNWQYADREQNLSNRERKARDMEGALHHLSNRIHKAKKASEGLSEAANAAQQAAIAISMKEKGQKPKNKGVAEGSLEEYGDTAKGQKMLTKVQKRAVDRVTSKKTDTDPAYAKKNSDTANRAWDRMTDKDVAEGSDKSVVHRIGLTVTDPNHPMASKRGDTFHKSVLVPGGDREEAIKKAINHYRKKNFDVHDHQYLGTVDESVSEESKGLWANIHAKRERIKHGSGEHMRKPGSKGAPTADALRKSAK